MQYGKHLVSTNGNGQLNAYFRHFAGYLTCSYNFCGYKRPRKLKTANIYPHVLEAKTRKFGDAKLFHFTVLRKMIFSLSISLNMYFGRSKERSHRDSSFEYPQLMFWLRNKINNFQLRTLIWGLIPPDSIKIPSS